jgi:hypothetical protein
MRFIETAFKEIYGNMDSNTLAAIAKQLETEHPEYGRT